MASEILNNAQVTPGRLSAFVRLVARRGTITKEELYSLLQPRSLVDKEDASADVFTACDNLELIIEGADKTVKVAPEILDYLDNSEAFRQILIQLLCGVSDPQANNYLLNEFTAWYAVQQERIFENLRGEQLAERFNSELYPDADLSGGERRFNSTKFIGWRTWAAYLGWGWVYPFGRSSALMPDATRRLEPLLPDLLPDSSPVRIDDFMEQLKDRCPELDGGSVYQHCWSAVRPNEPYANQLSLMLSTALRALHARQVIQLRRERDSSELRLLYRAEGQTLYEISHIQRITT